MADVDDSGFKPPHGRLSWWFSKRVMASMGKPMAVDYRDCGNVRFVSLFSSKHPDRAVEFVLLYSFSYVHDVYGPVYEVAAVPARQFDEGENKDLYLVVFLFDHVPHDQEKLIVPLPFTGHKDLDPAMYTGYRFLQDNKLTGRVVSYSNWLSPHDR